MCICISLNIIIFVHRQYAVNVKAVVNVSQVVAKGMIERGNGGCIINVSSLVKVKSISVPFIFCFCD